MSEKTHHLLGELGPTAFFTRHAAMKEAQKAMTNGIGQTMTKEQRRHAVCQSNWDEFLSDERVDEIIAQIEDAQREWLLTLPDTASDDPDAPQRVDNHCAKCDEIIPRTGLRGRPAKHCSSCKESIAETKTKSINLCKVCNKEIPNTGRRGRQPSKHDACK